MRIGRRSNPNLTRRAASLTACACLALAGCGFQLEGRAPLPKALRATYVQSGNSQSEFAEGLRRALIISGARVTNRRTAATAVVHILEDRVTPRIVSVSSTNLPREYELIYTVRLSVTSRGKTLLAPQTLSVTRDYAYDEHVVLAKERERSILRAALARDLVNIVMRRLESL